MIAIAIQASAKALPLATASVDLVVTSPPFWRQRAYGVPDEIGQEATPQEYITALRAATAEAARVLRPGRSLFVNLGDTYHKKSLVGVPAMYHLAVLDMGLTVRAEIVWNKTCPKPESMRDRVRQAHEVWFHITNGARYYAAMDGLRYPHSPVTLARARRGRVTPHAPAGQSPQRRRETQPNPLGALPGSVWSVGAARVLRPPPEVGKRHTAPFSEEWPRRFITGWCPPGGVVVDPCGGSGTVAVVAAAMGCTGISVDTSEECCRVARWRAGVTALTGGGRP